VFLAGQLRPDLLDGPSSFPLWIMVVTLNPLMGFWNVFVYVKPTLWREKRKQKTRENQKQEKSGSVPGSWSKQKIIPQTSDHAMFFDVE